jgi:hypothetical protein
MPNHISNSTNYEHSNESNLVNLHKAMDYNSVGQPVIRTVGGDIYNSINLPAGFGQVHKFGAVPAMSIDTVGTIWDEDDTIYPWAHIDANGALNIKVTNTNNENIANTDLDGDTVEIQGLDENYEVQTETVTISGSTATTANPYKRIYRARYQNGGSFDVNTSARILIQTSTNVTVAKILENQGQTLMSIYTIPAGFTGYLMRLDVTAQETATGEFKLMVREGGVGSFAIRHVAEVTGRGGPYQLEYPIPQSFPEKSDIDARIHTFANNGRYTCTFDILLVDNTAGTP